MHKKAEAQSSSREISLLIPEIVMLEKIRREPTSLLNCGILFESIFDISCEGVLERVRPLDNRHASTEAH